MITIREPMKDHTLSRKKDMKWASGASNRSLGSATDTSSCGSVRSFADDGMLSKKRVQFATMSRQRKISSHKRMSSSTKRKVWYGEQEAQRIRSDAKRAAVKACTIDTQYADAVNHLCKDVCVLAQALDNYEINVLLTDVDFLSNMSENLNGSQSWEDDDTFRGLEDLISNERRFMRYDVGDEIKAMVVKESNHSSTYSAEEVARYYKEMSMSSIVNARIAAVADEAAAEDIYAHSSWE